MFGKRFNYLILIKQLFIYCHILNKFSLFLRYKNGHLTTSINSISMRAINIYRLLVENNVNVEFVIMLYIILQKYF